jgi:hypothetical protein
MGKECNKIAAYKITLNKKNICVCKSCLNNLYDRIGKVLIPKSPCNFLNDEKMKKADFDHPHTSKNV